MRKLRPRKSVLGHRANEWQKCDWYSAIDSRLYYPILPTLISPVFGLCREKMCLPGVDCVSFRGCGSVERRLFIT